MTTATSLEAQHQFDLKVYHEDVDIGGVVYNANYLKYMERARTEWFEACGLDQLALIQQGILFVVRRAQIEFIKAAKFADKLQVRTQVTKRGKASIEFLQSIISLNQDCEICTGQIKVACVNDALKPIAIPKEILSEF